MVGSQGARCGPQGKHHAWALVWNVILHSLLLFITSCSTPITGEKKAAFGLWTTHQEARQATDSGV
jgi:hypothetical protein